MTSLTTHQREVRNADDFRRAFTILHHAAVGVILVRTREPLRAVDVLRQFAFADNLEFKRWSVLHGWTTYNSADPSAEPQTDNNADPVASLKMIQAIGGGTPWGDGIYAFMYPHLINMNKNPTMIQIIKEYVKLFAEDKKRLVLITPLGYELPVELSDDVIILDFEPPSYAELREMYDHLIETIPENRRPRFSDSKVDRVLAAGAGMVAHEFETAVSRSLVTYRSELPNVTIEQVTEVVLKVKTEMVKKSEVLELMEPEDMNNVGGLDGLKEWLTARAGCYTQEARDFGIRSPRGCLFAGPPGCVAAGTMIGYRRGKRNSYRLLPIDVLYDKFHGQKTSVPPGWMPGIDTFVQSWDAQNGKVFYNRLEDVIDKGEKLCIRITTQDTGEVILTPDHPVLTTGGKFVPAGSLLPGDKILVRGNMLPSSNRKEKSFRRPRVVVEGLKYYRGGWPKLVEDRDSGKIYEYRRQHHARLVIEAHMNKMGIGRYIDILKNDPETAETLMTLDREFDVHHMDEDPMNDSLENLCVILHEEHTALHSRGQENFNVEFVKGEIVTQVDDLGPRRVFDLVMASPAHNFVVNEGIIVHNTGKSLMAKAVAFTMQQPLIRFDVSRVFQSLVGSSEQRVREALKMVDAMSPCVLLVDEVDKAFQSNASNSDSGVGTRVLGAILTWLQESTAPVFVVMTANRVDTLPAELTRRGRLDEVFSVNMPNEDERLAILTIHLRKRGKDVADVTNIGAAVERSSGYMGAELEAAVADALIDAFTKNVPLNGELIAEQLGNMKPLSEAHAEQFAAMSTWAVNNARPANTGEQPPPRHRTRAPAEISNRAGYLDG